jgi:hypothetical protein
MQIRAKYHAIALAVFMLAVPVWAHTATAPLTVTESATIGGKQLKPGDYNLQVKDNQTQLKVVDAATGKTIVEVPVQWIQLQQKPNTTQVLVNNNEITEIDFGGKTQAVQITNHNPTGN